MSLSGDKGVAQFKKSVKMEHPSVYGLYMLWRELYWHCNFFFDKVSHLKHPSVPSSFPSPGEKKMRLVQYISNIDLIYQEHDLSMVSFQIENEKHNSSQTNVTKFICKYKGNSFLSYWKICI